MNEVLGAIYRRDSHSLMVLLQGRKYQDRDKLNETLRIVLTDDSELTYPEKLESAQRLLLAGASPNIRTWNNQPILMAAVESNDLGVFHMLLDFAPDVDAVDSSNSTALHEAAKSGQADMIGYLLAAGADSNLYNDMGNTPLTSCFQHRDLELLDMLLIDLNVNSVNYNKQTHLHLATLRRYPEAVERLLANGASPSTADVHHCTPLMAAAERGDSTITSLLLKAGADVHKTNISGSTALHNACGSRQSSAECVRLLLEAGSNINAREPNGKTSLFIAIDSNNLHATRELIKWNCDVNIPGNADYRPSKICTPLELALSRGNVTAILMLTLSGCKYRKGHLEVGLQQIRMSSMHLDSPTDGDSNSAKYMVELIQQVTSPPQALAITCRKVIRNDFGAQLKTKIENMSLPSSIRDYILLNEMDGLFT